MDTKKVDVNAIIKTIARYIWKAVKFLVMAVGFLIISFFRLGIKLVKFTMYVLEGQFK